MNTAQLETISQPTSTIITRAQLKTLALQLSARQDELYTCKTTAQHFAVAAEIERLQGLMKTGRWSA